ncbi:DNA modification methylase [Elizabethkingia anophelis]|nr:DNA modification methylase [Elizabethkingia anophelis]
MKLPIHNWYRYTAGFSAEWVRQVVKTQDNKNSILDPFSGSGTVVLEAQLNGRNAVGIEAHKIIHKISEAKINWYKYDAEEFSSLAKDFFDLSNNFIDRSRNYPTLFQKCYDTETLSRLFALKEAYNTIDDNNIYKKLLWFTLTSIIRSVTQVAAAQWQYVQPSKKKIKIITVEDAYKSKVNQIVNDIKYYTLLDPTLGHSCINLDDSRRLNTVLDDSIDLVITSPPYVNNYDYADATRMELTYWYELDNWGDLQKIVKNDLIRACTQHVADVKNYVDEYFDSEVIMSIKDDLYSKYKILEKERLNHGGKKNYHLLILAYFKDISETFKSLRRVCANDADICFVIGDSAPYGIYIPVDEWMGKIAVSNGFNEYIFDKTRERNVKWKNRKHTVPLKEGHLWIK